MDQLSQNFSALMAERRNKIILAAIVVGFFIIFIVSMKSSSKNDGFTEIAYMPCKDTGVIEVNSLKVENCKKAASGFCSARPGEQMVVLVDFEPKKHLDDTVLYQEIRNMAMESSWELTSLFCGMGLKCPIEPGVKQSIMSSFTVWAGDTGEPVSYRLKLGPWRGDPYVCLEFTLEIDN